MKAFDRLFAAVVGLIALVFVLSNLFLTCAFDNDKDREYMVEINRLSAEIAQNGLSAADVSGCDYVTSAALYDGSCYHSKGCDYTIREVDGCLYRFDYRLPADIGKSRLALNAASGVMALIIIGTLIFVRQKILLPFSRFRDLPLELSKGNLTAPVKEEKSRFFGRFLWGIDLLREKIEGQKQKELQLHKEKKTLLLSLSHDIKTPLSAIKLSSQALARGLYKDPEKQRETAVGIGEKADEIESFVTKIIDAAREDFLNIEVVEGEFYLSELVAAISSYYAEKLSLNKTGLEIGSRTECILKGDFDRSIEVLQNLMENAIKYGDGSLIRMDFSQEENCLLITVKNGGCGLSESELPHIFESFWRGSNSSGAQGSGLGLYICRRIMTAMHGEIFAELCGEDISVTAVFRMA